MISPTLLATLGIAYMFVLFLVAWLADRRVDAGRLLLSSKAMRGLVYALSLGVYCSSWTFYGAVGTANTGAWAHAPIYMGPILLMPPAFSPNRISLSMQTFNIWQHQD
ncbi:MAG: hypothetical protein P8O79_02895 [Halieaceae bacterium]|nr:hypothetical protein [Halieaceae bacterium]